MILEMPFQSARIWSLIVKTAMAERGARIARIQGPVPPSAQRAYEAHVLPALVDLVVAWWCAFDGADKAAWRVSASLDAGIYIDAPDDDPYDTICCPRELTDGTLIVGWQRYRNTSIRDAKCEIAERMIVMLLDSDALAAHIEIEEMDDVAEDLGLYQRTRGYVSEDEQERAREAREDAEEAAATARRRATDQDAVRGNRDPHTGAHAAVDSDGDGDTDRSGEGEGDD